MHEAWLDDRGVIEISGAGARDFLQGLVTNDVHGLMQGEAAFAALLTPQGKIIADFFVTPGRGQDDSLYIDCPRGLAADLVRQLTVYRLRAKLTISDLSESFGVNAFWGEGRSGPEETLATYGDPREEGLGWRAIVSRTDTSGATGPADSVEAYEAHRIALGVPRGGIDFAYGDTFPHDANMDHLHGIDFKKGCYVGQEVVSRVEHRGTARKRILKVGFEGAAPAAGTEVDAGDVAVGTFGSSTRNLGLAMLRTDKVQEAAASGTKLHAGTTELRLAQ